MKIFGRTQTVLPSFSGNISEKSESPVNSPSTKRFADIQKQQIRIIFDDYSPGFACPNPVPGNISRVFSEKIVLFSSASSIFINRTVNNADHLDLDDVKAKQLFVHLNRMKRSSIIE